MNKVIYIIGGILLVIVLYLLYKMYKEPYFSIEKYDSIKKEGVVKFGSFESNFSKDGGKSSKLVRVVPFSKGYKVFAHGKK